MKKTTKFLIYLSIFFMILGLIIFGGVMTMLKWDFRKLSSFKYQTNNYEITEEYNNLTIITDTANVLILPSENSQTSIVCYEQKNANHSVAVQNGALEIKLNDIRKWHERIGIDFSSPKITVYLPQGEHGALSVKLSTGDVEISKEFKFESIEVLGSTGDVRNYASSLNGVKITTSTGDILLEDITAQSVDLAVSTGKIIASDLKCEGDFKVKVSTGRTSLTRVSCKNLTSTGNTGSIKLASVIAIEKFDIKRTTGSVKFELCDAKDIFIETDTGDVEGTLLSEKIFLPRSSTGDIDVPKTVNGGRCEVTTSTGDIEITIVSK